MVQPVQRLLTATEKVWKEETKKLVFCSGYNACTLSKSTKSSLACR